MEHSQVDDLAIDHVSGAHVLNAEHVQKDKQYSLHGSYASVLVQ